MELQPVPAKINGLDVIAHRPATLAPSEICVVVLCRRDDEYISWTWNRQNPGAHHGHYGMDLPKAVGEFATRHDPVRRRWWTITGLATEAERIALEAA